MAKLINKKTGKEVKVGDTVTTFRGEKAVLEGFKEPHKSSSTGKVYVKFEGAEWSDQFYPSVIGCEIVEHQFSDSLLDAAKASGKLIISHIK